MAGTVASVVSLLLKLMVISTAEAALRVTVPMAVPPFSLIDVLFIDNVKAGTTAVKFQSVGLVIPPKVSAASSPYTLTLSTANQPPIVP